MIIKSYFIVIIIFLINLISLGKLHSQEYKNKEVDTFDIDINKVYMSREYARGSFLIYDCIGKYFACVDKASNYNCVEKRDKAKTFSKKNLECAPLKFFKTDELCKRELYINMYKLNKKTFCFLE